MCSRSSFEHLLARFCPSFSQWKTEFGDAHTNCIKAFLQQVPTWPHTTGESAKTYAAVNVKVAQVQLLLQRDMWGSDTLLSSSRSAFASRRDDDAAFASS